MMIYRGDHFKRPDSGNSFSETGSNHWALEYYSLDGKENVCTLKIISLEIIF